MKKSCHSFTTDHTTSANEHARFVHTITRGIWRCSSRAVQSDRQWNQWLSYELSTFVVETKYCRHEICRGKTQMRVFIPKPYTHCCNVRDHRTTILWLVVEIFVTLTGLYTIVWNSSPPMMDSSNFFRPPG